MQRDVGSTMRNKRALLRPPLVIGCGALARELVDLTRRAGLPAMDLTCLPASLHNRPERIPGAVAARIRRARRDGYERIFLAYADCGTGGLLDRMLETEPTAGGVARLASAHCYEVYAGRAAFAALHDEQPGTFYLTDYLARNFDRLVIRGLGLDRHPELLPEYFGNYRRLVYLAQQDDAALTAAAEAAADRLGLIFERRLVGLGELDTAVRGFSAASNASQTRNPVAGPAPMGDIGRNQQIHDGRTCIRSRRARMPSDIAGTMSVAHESPREGRRGPRLGTQRRGIMSTGHSGPAGTNTRSRVAA